MLPGSLIGFFSAVALWVVAYVLDIEPWMVGGRRYMARHARKRRS